MYYSIAVWNQVTGKWDLETKVYFTEGDECLTTMSQHKRLQVATMRRLAMLGAAVVLGQHGEMPPTGRIILPYDLPAAILSEIERLIPVVPEDVCGEQDNDF